MEALERRVCDKIPISQAVATVSGHSDDVCIFFHEDSHTHLYLSSQADENPFLLYLASCCGISFQAQVMPLQSTALYSL